ncbi:MAG TPA: asparagine synthase (glutamine-hydrolyzing) [Steroidobacteraceae bacterium]|nr:asparagine synthase (glutamine-hydrolyzing) [Steroidobacteraceae bacterium]
MCGIAGIVSESDLPDGGLRRMLDALAHRGPDGEGIEADSHAAFGHRRLSIIDLEGGRQPLVNAAGTHWLVCNGEIYNYRELRAECAARGYRFLTGSDCEVILALYEHCGDALLERLRGMFAFALWDAPRRRLLAARDHLGQKPFYYTQGRTFAFASEIKALLALDPQLRELDLRALDQYLGLRLIAPPLSMFRRIRKLPPGHKLVFEPGKPVEIAPYWRLRFEPKLTLDEDALVDELDERLAEALRLHMESDVPVGAFLSGGMDSGLIVAMLATRLGIRDLPTFTVDLPHQRYSEGRHARRVAAECGTVHHEWTLEPSLLAALPDLVWHLDEPSDPLSVCTYLLAQRTRRHVKVVLGGDGGDELFGGYDRYYGTLYAGEYARVPHVVRHAITPLISLVPEAGWYKSVGHQLKWLHRLSFLSGGERYAASLAYFYFDAASRRGLYTPDVQRVLGLDRAESVIAERFADGDGDSLDRMLFADSTIRLPDHPVMISDRMSMAWGLEVRSPFMDHRVAEFAARIPGHCKVRGRELRHIQKRLARRYLPPDILDRPKQGFSSALPYILREEYRMLYRELLSPSELVRAGILRREPIERLLGEQLSGRRDHGNRLWLLINAELWFRMLIQGTAREELGARLAALARYGRRPVLTAARAATDSAG